jgi:hypothetical protein
MVGLLLLVRTSWANSRRRISHCTVYVCRFIASSVARRESKDSSLLKSRERINVLLHSLVVDNTFVLGACTIQQHHPS